MIAMTSMFFAMCTSMDGFEEAWSATGALQLCTLYGPKSPILPLMKMLLFPPEEYKSRRTSAKMKRKKLLMPNIDM